MVWAYSGIFQIGQLSRKSRKQTETTMVPMAPLWFLKDRSEYEGFVRSK